MKADDLLAIVLDTNKTVQERIDSLNILLKNKHTLTLDCYQYMVRFNMQNKFLKKRIETLEYANDNYFDQINELYRINDEITENLKKAKKRNTELEETIVSLNRKYEDLIRTIKMYGIIAGAVFVTCFVFYSLTR